MAFLTCIGRKLKQDKNNDIGWCNLSGRCFSICNVHVNRLKCVCGRCHGYNEYHNMYNAGRHFTTILLPYGAPLGLQSLVMQVVKAYETCSLDTKQLLVLMKHVVAAYRTGKHLNRAKSDRPTSKICILYVD